MPLGPQRRSNPLPWGRHARTRADHGRSASRLIDAPLSCYGFVSVEDIIAAGWRGGMFGGHKVRKYGLGLGVASLAIGTWPVLTLFESTPPAASSPVPVSRLADG